MAKVPFLFRTDIIRCSETRTEEDNEQVDFILIYDNNGTLRSEIPIRSYRSCRLLFEGSTMYYSTSADEIAALDSTGRITRLYDTGDYKLHHDYIFGSRNDFLALATDTRSDTTEDRIISIDRDRGDVTELIDLADLFPEYFDSLEIDEDDFDWMHINSLCLTDEGYPDYQLQRNIQHHQNQRHL